MSTLPKPPLQLKATCLGPVAKLDAPLSKSARNMIYARNGTGKSFITRALRYLDMRWCRYLRQGHKVDLPMKRTIQHEDTQTVYSRVQGQGCA